MAPRGVRLKCGARVLLNDDWVNLSERERAAHPPYARTKPEITMRTLQRRAESAGRCSKAVTTISRQRRGLS
jgi:hypothetical protein